MISSVGLVLLRKYVSNVVVWIRNLIKLYALRLNDTVYTLEFNLFFKLFSIK